VTVRADHRYADAERILREHDAYDVKSRHQGVAAADATRVRSTPELLAEVADALRLREEEHGLRSTALWNELLSLEESPVDDLKQDLTLRSFLRVHNVLLL
jgi:hypothetical protein